jgi:hypothetical protein
VLDVADAALGAIQIELLVAARLAEGLWVARRPARPGSAGVGAGSSVVVMSQRASASPMVGCAPCGTSDVQQPGAVELGEDAEDAAGAVDVFHVVRLASPARPCTGSAPCGSAVDVVHA